MSDGRVAIVPYADYERLAGGSASARQAWEWIGRGYGIRWDELDEDLSVAGIARDYGEPARLEIYEEVGKGTRGTVMKWSTKKEEPHASKKGAGKDNRRWVAKGDSSAVKKSAKRGGDIAKPVDRGVKRPR